MVELPVSQYDELTEADTCYLNNAAQTQLSSSVRTAGLDILTRPAWTLDSDLDENKRSIRRYFATLLKADSSSIAIMPSTAFAITLAAQNVAKRELKDGGKILVLQNQMCSAVYPWQVICNHENVSLKVVLHPQGDGDLTANIMDALVNDNNVRVACLPLLHWSDGSLLDLQRIADKCHEKNILLIVDATQSIGILPFDVTKIRPAIVACSVQKWLCAPPGISLVYISKDLYPTWQPLDQHGRSRALKPNWNADPHTMQPSGYPENYVHDASKFDSGGKGNPVHLAMLAASLGEVVKLDVDQAQLQLRQLIEPLLTWVQNHPLFSLPRNHANHIFGIRPLPETISVDEMLEICTKLENEGIFVSVRNGVFRISPYLTNTSSDIEAFIASFDRHIDRFQSK